MLDSYYERKYNEVKAGKDSIFEPCKILAFDATTMTATVYFTRSSKERENVLVLFPSLSLTSGLLSIPSENTTALAFWGPDRQVYVLPAQYLMGRNDVEGGIVTQSASPSNFDPDLSYDHLRPGEHYMFSPGGQFHLDRDGNIELINKEMCFLRIEEDGTIRTSSSSRHESTDYHEEQVYDRMAGTRRGAVEERTFYSESYDEQSIADSASAMASAIAASKGSIDLSSYETPPRHVVLRERSGLVGEGSDWLTVGGDGERVVKEWAVDGVTIRLGEHGHVEVSNKGTGFRVSITKDDLTMHRPDGDVSFNKMADRLMRLSRMNGIEEGLG